MNVYEIEKCKENIRGMFRKREDKDEKERKYRNKERGVVA